MFNKQPIALSLWWMHVDYCGLCFVKSLLTGARRSFKAHCVSLLSLNLFTIPNSLTNVHRNALPWVFKFEQTNRKLHSGPTFCGAIHTFSKSFSWFFFENFRLTINNQSNNQLNNQRLMVFCEKIFYFRVNVTSRGFWILTKCQVLESN